MKARNPEILAIRGASHEPIDLKMKLIEPFHEHITDRRDMINAQAQVSCSDKEV